MAVAKRYTDGDMPAFPNTNSGTVGISARAYIAAKVFAACMPQVLPNMGAKRRIEEIRDLAADSVTAANILLEELNR